MRNRWCAKLFAAPLLAAGVAVIAACGSSTPPATSPGHSPAASAPGGAQAPAVMIMTHSTAQGTVLTNAQGKTLYWFAIDTSTSSKCTGTCATYWPPVIGDPTAASGTSLPMSFGTIKRSDGTTQATYDGHPLYTYVSDSAPGQIGGNGKNLSGGLWWAMTPSGSKLGATTGGGY